MIRSMSTSFFLKLSRDSYRFWLTTLNFEFGVRSTMMVWRCGMTMEMKLKILSERLIFGA